LGEHLFDLGVHDDLLGYIEPHASRVPKDLLLRIVLGKWNDHKSNNPSICCTFHILGKEHHDARSDRSSTCAFSFPGLSSTFGDQFPESF
jgi:hypothetical protein